MDARSKPTWGLFEGPAWPVDNTSEFEPDLSEGSSELSLGYESIISEDLDLYKDRWGFLSHIGLGGLTISRKNMALTDEQLDMLNECIDNFRAAIDYESQEEIVQNLCCEFRNNWTWRIKFQRAVIEAVCRPSVTPGCSNIFLDYLPASLWQNKAGHK